MITVQIPDLWSLKIYTSGVRLVIFYHAKFISMQTKDCTDEINDLEIQMAHYEKLLDMSFRNNEILAKTKLIYHQLKKISERLTAIKQISEQKTES